MEVSMIVKCEECGGVLRSIQMPVEIGGKYVCALCGAEISQERLDLLLEQKLQKEEEDGNKRS
jgi:DNA-directed RNA polymerase subunit RPC12/RpoP